MASGAATASTSRPSLRAVRGSDRGRSHIEHQPEPGIDPDRARSVTSLRTSPIPTPVSSIRPRARRGALLTVSTPVTCQPRLASSTPRSRCRCRGRGGPPVGRLASALLVLEQPGDRLDDPQFSDSAFPWMKPYCRRQSVVHRRPPRCRRPSSRFFIEVANELTDFFDRSRVVVICH